MSIGLPCSSRVTRVRLLILAFFTLISSTCSDGVPFCTHAPNRSEGEGPSRSLCPRVPSTNVCVPAPTHRSSRGFHHPRAQTPAYGHFDNSIYEHVGEKVSVRRCTPGGPHGFVFSTLIVPVAYRSSIERIRRFFRLFSGRPFSRCLLQVSTHSPSDCSTCIFVLRSTPPFAFFFLRGYVCERFALD